MEIQTLAADECQLWTVNGDSKVFKPLFCKGHSFEDGCGPDWIQGHFHFPVIAQKQNVTIIVHALEESTREGEERFDKRTRIFKIDGQQQQWLGRCLADPHSMITSVLDTASTIFQVMSGTHCPRLSVPADIQEPPDEDEAPVMTEEPEQGGESNPEVAQPRR